MHVGHDAQDVAERVDHRSGDESGTAFGDSLELLGSQGLQPLERARQVVDVPVDDGARGPATASGTGREVLGNKLVV